MTCSITIATLDFGALSAICKDQRARACETITARLSSGVSVLGSRNAKPALERCFGPRFGHHRAIGCRWIRRIAYARIRTNEFGFGAFALSPIRIPLSNIPQSTRWGECVLRHVVQSDPRQVQQVSFLVYHPHDLEPKRYQKSASWDGHEPLRGISE